MCEHKFVHLRSDSFKQANGRYTTKYVSSETFFCEKCLYEAVKKKEMSICDGQEHTLPEWARVITTKVPSDYYY